MAEEGGARPAEATEKEDPSSGDAPPAEAAATASLKSGGEDDNNNGSNGAGPFSLRPVFLGNLRTGYATEDGELVQTCSFRFQRFHWLILRVVSLVFLSSYCGFRASSKRRSLRPSSG